MMPQLRNGDKSEGVFRWLPVSAALTGSPRTSFRTKRSAGSEATGRPARHSVTVYLWVIPLNDL